MSNFNFACRFEKLEDGTEIVRCRDLPELLSYSTNEMNEANGEPIDNESLAKYAVLDAIAFRFGDRTAIPEATSALPGEFVVELTLNQVAKILLSNEMVFQGISRAELARRTGLKLPEITRLLSINHPTKIERIDAAMRVLGKRFTLLTI